MKPKQVFNDKQKTALQNALRKCSLIRYLARDKDGALWGYSHKPKRTQDGWLCNGGGGSTYIYLPNSITTAFPQITWEDEEPTSCEEILGELKQIEEMAQAMSDFELEDTANCDIELSRHLIAKGYRKQSEVIAEFVEKINLVECEMFHKAHDIRNSSEEKLDRCNWKDDLQWGEYKKQEGKMSALQDLMTKIKRIAAQYGVNPEEV